MSGTPLVWVPGGTGMLGRAVCRILAARSVRALPTGSELDIASPSAVDAFVEAHPGLTAILNCAAKTAVDVCESEPDDAMRVNGEGPRSLALAARRVGAVLVHVSTDYVFDGTHTAAYREDDVTRPVTLYGKSKIQGERALWQALGDESQGYVVRTAWLFGHEGKNFVSTMLRLMREREAVQVVMDQRGSPTFCDDLAEALVDVAGIGRSSRPPGGTYHFVNEGETTWHGLAEATWTYANERGAKLRCKSVEPVTSEAFVRPAKRPAFSVLSTDKIAGALGRAPRSWSDALSAYLAREESLTAAR